METTSFLFRAAEGGAIVLPSLVQGGHITVLFSLPLYSAVENCAVQSAHAVLSAPRGRIQERGPRPPSWSVGRGFPKGEANRNASPFGVSFVPFCTSRKGPQDWAAQAQEKSVCNIPQKKWGAHSDLIAKHSKFCKIPPPGYGTPPLRCRQQIKEKKFFISRERAVTNGP